MWSGTEKISTETGPLSQQGITGTVWAEIEGLVSPPYFVCTFSFSFLLLRYMLCHFLSSEGDFSLSLRGFCDCFLHINPTNQQTAARRLFIYISALR